MRLVEMDKEKFTNLILNTRCNGNKNGQAKIKRSSTSMKNEIPILQITIRIGGIDVKVQTPFFRATIKDEIVHPQMYNGRFKSSLDHNTECSFYEGEGAEKNGW